MNVITRKVGSIILGLGWDPRRLVATIRFMPTFLGQVVTVLSNHKRSIDGFKLRWTPILSDCHMPGGTAKGHYFHQDLWAARRIFVANPRDHIDIGSRVDGFVAHLLAFRSVRVIDIRPLVSKIDRLTFEQIDMMGTVPDDLTADSVSCLHALEHFGLGRYGDPLDFEGWKKGLYNLSKITRVGGHLYLSVPIGQEQCIEFNAQRIFKPITIIDTASSFGLELIEFSYIDDNGDFLQHADMMQLRCNYGCGCFIFIKKHKTTA